MQGTSSCTFNCVFASKMTVLHVIQMCEQPLYTFSVSGGGETALTAGCNYSHCTITAVSNC